MVAARRVPLDDWTETTSVVRSTGNRARGDALALFGCGLHRPLVHCGSAGLLWAIASGRLVELHRDWAVFELAENGSRRIFERRRLEAGNVRLPWIGA